MAVFLDTIQKTIVDEGGVHGELRGDGPVQVLFIGEALGRTEMEKGRPFLGPTGQLLDAMCREAGITSYYVTNACYTFPGYDGQGKLKKPTVEELARWRPFLNHEIKAVNPPVIVTLGLYAMKWAWPGCTKVGPLVGAETEVDGRRVIGAYYPAMFLHGQGTDANVRRMNQQRRAFEAAARSEARKVEYEYWVMPRHEADAEHVIDVETNGLDVRSNKIMEWSVLPTDRDTAILCFDQGFLPARPKTAIFHNAMFDYPILCRHDNEWFNVTDVHDTMLLAYSQGYPDLTLKGLAHELLGIKVYTYNQREECGAEYYNAQDVHLTKKLYEFLMPHNKGTAYDIDRALVPLLTRASLLGGYEIDKKKVAALIEQKRQFANEQRRLIETHTQANANSPTALAEALGLPDTKADTLRQDNRMITDAILMYRSEVKDLQYLEPALRVDRYRGLYSLTRTGDEQEGSEESGTATGRLSSHDFNMQNIDPELQACLHAPKNMRLLRADYNQIELRVAAQLSGAKFLRDIMRDEKRNLHEETREFMRQYNIDLEYKQAKGLNFMTLYLGGANRAAQLLGCDMKTATYVVEKLGVYWAAFHDWAAEHWDGVQTTGKSVGMAPYNHVRSIWIPGNYHAEKQAVNHPIQNGAGYICKESLVTLGSTPEREFVNQIHDELHFFVRKEEVKQREHEVRDAMISIAEQRLPDVGARVGIATSRTWEGKE